MIGCSLRGAASAGAGLRIRVPERERAVRGGQPFRVACEADYFQPSFLRISFGTALRLTMIDMVLYSTNGREKYQNPP